MILKEYKDLSKFKFLDLVAYLCVMRLSLFIILYQKTRFNN